MVTLKLKQFVIITNSLCQTAGVWGSEGDSQPVMWAVTDMEAVPSGALLINPQVFI